MSDVIMWERGEFAELELNDGSWLPVQIVSLDGSCALVSTADGRRDWVRRWGLRRPAEPLMVDDRVL